ncbi:MAG: polyphosphate kinase 2 family protein [Candidatus Roseilinea sp.]|uniref:polyphosphate kinase 2 family protein n=1 Tax=Candidatus Roseilinea sp. TaxID=2838777 RepID=UPI00404A7176
MQSDPYLIKPGARVDLSKFDPADTSRYNGRKGDARQELDELTDRLEVLQELMYAESRRKLLIVLQGMDTSGKDGVIRHVFEGVNPQGVRVANFKAPTPVELSRDYLWRVHAHTPGSGEIVIFNRSHYEDVLIVRVQGLVEEAVWRRRYEHINAFEKLLADEGTTILKFFLHISKDEQKKRLQARLDDPTKQWKFNVGDLKERARWDDYMRAYEDVLSKTSTEWAPWRVVPSDVKWYRNLVIARAIVSALEGFQMTYPQPKEDLSKVVIE